MANWTTLDELIRKITRRRVVELFDDDGDGDITGTDADTIGETVAAANDEVTSIMFRKGFDAAALNELSEDASLRRYATSILAQHAGERRVEFLDDAARGPVHSPPPGTRKRGAAGSKAFSGTGSECERCHGGRADRPCTCVVQDRCSELNDRGHQCILGAGHTLRHVTAAGKHWS